MRRITSCIFSTSCLLAACLTPLASADNDKARNSGDLVNTSKARYRQLQNGRRAYQSNSKSGSRTFRGIVEEEGRKVGNPRRLNSDGTRLVIENGLRVVNPRHRGSDGTQIVIEDGRRVVNPRRTNARPTKHPGVDWRSKLTVGDDAQLADEAARVNSAVINERTGKRRNSSGLLEPIIHRNIVNPRAPISNRNRNRGSKTQNRAGARPRGWNEVSGKIEPVIARDKINPKNDLQRIRQRQTHISLEQDGIHLKRKK